MPVQNSTGKAHLIEGYSKCTNSQVLLIPNTSTQILPANADRAYAVFINNSDAPITLALFRDTGVATINQGIVLNARGSNYEIGITNLFLGRVVGIAPTAAALGVIECSFT